MKRLLFVGLSFLPLYACKTGSKGEDAASPNSPSVSCSMIAGINGCWEGNDRNYVRVSSIGDKTDMLYLVISDTEEKVAFRCDDADRLLMVSSPNIIVSLGNGQYKQTVAEDKQEETDDCAVANSSGDFYYEVIGDTMRNIKKKEIKP